MTRTPVNPWDWSLPFGFNQGEIVEGATRTLYCAGQTALDAEAKPQHAGDLGAQLALALDNLEAVLAQAGMTLSNVVRLNIYTTDMDAIVSHHETLVSRLAAANVRPVQTWVGVTRLAYPELMVELEATAVA